jgi:hypothetical protein
MLPIGRLPKANVSSHRTAGAGKRRQGATAPPARTPLRVGPDPDSRAAPRQRTAGRAACQGQGCHPLAKPDPMRPGLPAVRSGWLRGYGEGRVWPLRGPVPPRLEALPAPRSCRASRFPARCRGRAAQPKPSQRQGIKRGLSRKREKGRVSLMWLRGGCSNHALNIMQVILILQRLACTNRCKRP